MDADKWTQGAKSLYGVSLDSTHTSWWSYTWTQTTYLYSDDENTEDTQTPDQTQYWTESLDHNQQMNDTMNEEDGKDDSEGMVNFDGMTKE